MSSNLQLQNDLNYPVVVVKNISKKYCRDLKRSLWYGIKDIMGEMLLRRSPRQNVSLRKSEFWSLQNISFELYPGEALAIIGANGAGKSTLLKILYGLIKPDTGLVHIKGSIGAMIELGTGLDPVLSGRENIYIRGALFGISKEEMAKLFDKIVEFAGLEESIDMPVQYYSSGMVARLGFAVSAHLNTNILLVDEVLAVGDIDFQRKCINHMLNYLSQGGSLILVSHSPYHIQSVCKRAILLEDGCVTKEGTAVDTLDFYLAKQNQKFATQNTLSNDFQLQGERLVTIESVSFEPLEGNIIETGSKVSVKVNYTALADFNEIAWGFSLWTNDDITCISGDINPEPIKLSKGSGTLNCTIPRMPLTQGKYLVKTIIVQMPTVQPLAISGWMDSPLQIDIYSPKTVWGNYGAMFKQLTQMEINWEK